MKIKLRLIVYIMLCMIACTAFAVPVTKTYTFTSKEWKAVDEDKNEVQWISDKDNWALEFKPEQGAQVSSSVSGASATSPIVYNKISKIVFIYNTNTQNGKGTIEVQIGDNKSNKNNVVYSQNNVPEGKNGTNADFTTTFSYSKPQDGNIYYKVSITENSIYIKSISITYEDESTIAIPTFTPAGGTYSEAQDVKISCATEGVNIYYTTDGSEPTVDSEQYGGSSIHIETTTTIKAIAIKDGEMSAVATATYTITTSDKRDAKFAFDEETYYVNKNAESLSFPKLSYAEGYNGEIVYSSSNEEVAKIDAKGEITIAGVGETIIKATAEETEDFCAAEASYTLIVNAGFEKEDGVFDFTMGEDYGSGTTIKQDYSNVDLTVRTWTSGIVKMETSGRVVWYNGNKLVLMEKGGSSNEVVGTCEFSVPEGYAITQININSDGDERLVAKVADSDGSGQLEGNVWTGKAKKVTIAHNNSGNIVNIKKISVTYVPTTVSVKIGPSQFISLCREYYALDLSNVKGLAAYIISEIGTSTLTLKRISAAPANTPMILNAPEGTYNLDIIESADEVGTNYLKVSDGNVTSNGYMYALANKDDGVTFYVVKEGVEIPEGKCYIETEQSEEIKSYLDLDFGVPDCIGKIDTGDTIGHGIYYNLNGQRVLNPGRGIYIINNKKVLIK